MLEFFPYDLSAVAVAQPFFAAKNDRLCDWTPASCFMWAEEYHSEYTVVADCFIVQYRMEQDYYYSMPVGENPEPALVALQDHCRQLGQPLRFSPLSAEQAQTLARRYAGIVKVCPLPDYADYLYRYEDLATFAGRRYSGQRNHINQFVKKYPTWTYRPLTAELTPAVLAFLDTYTQQKQQRGEMTQEELTDMDSVRTVLSHWDGLPLTGGVISVEGQIAGFAVGEALGDTLYVHIEKGDIRFPGIYQMLVREYAAHSAAPELQFINREDDAGDPGLRKSKLAYRPCGMVEKYSVILG